MSQIAQALAKAKERTGQTAAPFLAPGAPAPVSPAERATVSATALRQAKNRQRFWMILGLVTLPLTGFIVWSQLRESMKPDDSAPSGIVATSGPSSQPSVAPVRQSDAPPPVKVVAPRPELAQAVANLAISAVTPGDPAKMVLGGRVVRAGQTLDGGLTFVGIVDGQLQFTDATGAVYLRRY
jgi:hypothetical protein